jgi:hypothetical protein
VDYIKHYKKCLCTFEHTHDYVIASDKVDDESAVVTHEMFFETKKMRKL